MPPHHRCPHTSRPSVYASILRVFSHFSLAMRPRPPPHHLLSCVVLSSSEATFARRVRISCNDDDDALLCIYPPVFCFIHKRPRQASAIRSITPSLHIAARIPLHNGQRSRWLGIRSRQSRCRRQRRGFRMARNSGTGLEIRCVGFVASTTSFVRMLSHVRRKHRSGGTRRAR